MSKTKQKATTEGELLALLKKVLPKAAPDPQLAMKIYQAFEEELRKKAKVSAFQKFCDKVELPDLEPKTLMEVKRQLADSFNDCDVSIKPNKKEQTLTVEASLPDGSQYQSEIKVKAVGEDDALDPEVVLKFVPFPVCLPGDMELVWTLAKRENLTNEEAGVALSKVEEEFWASKTGQKLLRDRVERCFPEFIARVPAGMLSEVGLKRHYKTPEAIKAFRSIGQAETRRKH